MPLYEYRCGSCSRIFESYTRPSDEGKTPACPVCGGGSEKIGISLFSARGKGEGTRSGGSTCGGGSRRSPFS
jgi:putative FmdB family regulatory protein